MDLSITRKDAVRQVHEPLLTLPIARWRISFRAQERWPILGMEHRVRSRLGLFLKQRFCGRADFRNTPCPGCELARSCLYTVLFSPVPQPAGGQGETERDLPRPFILSVRGEDAEGCLPGGEAGSVDVTFVGPAIRYARPLLETLWDVVDDLVYPDPGHWPDHERPAEAAELPRPFTPVSLCKVIPDRTAGELEIDAAELRTQDKERSHPLQAWVDAQRAASANRRSPHSVAICMITPLRLHARGKEQKELFFDDLITAIVRRLRNLKRAYGEDADMGGSLRALGEQAKNVRPITDHCQWVDLTRRSCSQHQDVPRGGLVGKTRFAGEVEPYLPLLLAGSLLHVGKGVTNGQGRYVVEG